MSIGQIVGAIGGGIIGFIYGGPYGAVVGMSFGMAIGGYIDPVKPDIKQPGQPQTSELNLNIAQEGTIVYDLCGTSKISTGNIIWYDGERNEPITQTQEVGGKGGGGNEVTSITGYKYFLSWALVLCEGPISGILTIYKNDESVFNDPILLEDYPDGYADITLGGSMGAARIYFGTESQPQDPTMVSFLGAENVPNYKGVAYVLFNDCYVGDYNRAPTMRFVLSKFPETTLEEDNAEVGIYDYNPAHTIFYILKYHLEFEDDEIDLDSFNTAAETLYNEGHGISTLMDSGTPAHSYLETILTHSQGILRTKEDGKIYYKLIRYEGDSGFLPIVDEESMVDKPIFTRGSWMGTLNEVDVQYSKFYFTTECVLDAPVLTLLSHVGDDAYFRITPGCEPYMLQKNSTGSWIDVMYVEEEFKWMYTPEVCDSTLVRVYDVKARPSNSILLGATCSGLSSPYLTCSTYTISCDQTTTITINSPAENCEYGVVVDGVNNGKLVKVSDTTWSYTCPTGAGIEGSCCIDDYAIVKLFECDVLMDTALVHCYGGNSALIWWPGNPDSVSSNETVHIQFTGGVAPFFWTSYTSGAIWMYNKTTGRDNYLTITNVCSENININVTDACNSNMTYLLDNDCKSSSVEEITAQSIYCISQSLQVNNAISGCTYTWTIDGDGSFDGAELKTITGLTAYYYEATPLPDSVTITVSRCGGEVAEVELIGCDTEGFEWDTNSPQTVARENSVQLSILCPTTMCGVMTWTTNNEHFFFDNPESTSNSNWLRADGSACGSVTVTVEACLGDTVTGVVRCTYGSEISLGQNWNQWYDPILDKECTDYGGGCGCYGNQAMYNFWSGQYRYLVMGAFGGQGCAPCGYTGKDCSNTACAGFKPSFMGATGVTQYCIQGYYTFSVMNCYAYSNYYRWDC